MCTNCNLSLCVIIIDETQCEFWRKLWSTSYQTSRPKITDNHLCYWCFHWALRLPFPNPIYYESYRATWINIFINFPNNVFSLHEIETHARYFYDFIQSISNIRYKIFCQISCLWLWHQPKQLCEVSIL